MNRLETPPFVAYALARTCDLRTGRRPWEPLETERQLRPLRSYAEAVGAGRVIDGICVQWIDGDWHGFAVDGVLAAYGGQVEIQAACGSCPACAITTPNAPRWAGCYGWLAFESDRGNLSRSIESTLRDRRLAARVQQEFLTTDPAWYGLWAGESLNPAQLAVHQEIAARLVEVADGPAADGPAAVRRAIVDWKSAVECALAAGLPLNAAVIPGGWVEGRRWTTPPHCGRCHADRVGQLVRCAVCGLRGGVLPGWRRCARGTRPFQPLRVWFGARATDEFVSRIPRELKLEG